MINYLNLIMMTGAGGAEGQNPAQMFIMLGLIIVVFYFFMIRPQVKRQKEMKSFRDSLSKGDQVITTGGIYGKIASIKENKITLDVGNGVKLDIDKSAIVKDVADLAQGQQQQK